VESGVNHIDTSDFYGPHVTNELFQQALHPCLDVLVIVTKLGARRGSRYVLDSCSLPRGVKMPPSVRIRFRCEPSLKIESRKRQLFCARIRK
jgi:aryl-alcohol dehydrogenase-like predicted oxidoreductase